MSLPPISSEQKHLLSLGRVPLRRRYLLPRTELANQLYHRLRAFLQNPDSSWLLICGMTGCGKSELVAGVLWDRPELCFALVDRVIWITDRHMEPAQLELLAADALLLTTLCCTAGNGMDQTDAICSSNGSGLGLFTTIQKLKAIMLEQRIGITLFVLDGVQMVDTVRFFDQLKGPNCKILATSTNRALFEILDPIDIFQVPSDAISTDEVAQLGRIYGIKENWSEDQLCRIMAHTGGNMALLEKLFTMARGNVAIFLSLVARLPYRPLREFACHSAYPYSNLERPLQSCIKMLGHSLSRSFDFCSVLEPFAWTHFEILSLIWPLDVCGSESGSELHAMIAQQLDSLEANSLMDKREDRIASFQFIGFGTFQYRLNPLHCNFLLHSRPNSYTIFQQSARALLYKLRDHSQCPTLAPGDRQLFAQYLAQNETRLDALQVQLGGKRKIDAEVEPPSTMVVADGGMMLTEQNPNGSTLIGTVMDWLRSAAFWR